MDARMLEEYLKRIDIDAMPPVSPEGLRTIQKAYLERVPFENLDIIEGRLPLKLDEASLFQKIVREKRGGICYEHNLLYCSALRHIGFDAHMRGAGIVDDPTGLEHAFVMVAFPLQNEQPSPIGGAYEGRDWWLTDVGFGFNYAEPLHAVLSSTLSDGRDSFRLVERPDVGRDFLELKKYSEGDFSTMFIFGPQEYDADGYRHQCDAFSYDADSFFKSGPVISIDKAGCRVTLSANHYIETTNGIRREIAIESSDHFEELLRTVFKYHRPDSA